MSALRLLQPCVFCTRDALAARILLGARSQLTGRPIALKQERQTQTQLSPERTSKATQPHSFIYFPNTRTHGLSLPLADLSWTLSQADRRIGFDIEPCDCVIPLPAALHTAWYRYSYTLFFLGPRGSMLWFSSPSPDSFVRRAACSLSLLALLGSSGVSAQLNNETSPTHQFKSVGSSLLCFALLCF